MRGNGGNAVAVFRRRGRRVASARGHGAFPRRGEDAAFGRGARIETDVATAIVRALDLAEFDAPFVGPVLYSATEVADFDDFSRIVTLSFEAKIALI